MSEYKLKPVTGSMMGTVTDQRIEKDSSSGSSDFELDLTESSQPDDLPDILIPTNSTQPDDIPTDSTQTDELPDIYTLDESFDVKTDEIVEVDHALRRIELDQSNVTQGGIPEYESPIEDNADDTVVISDDTGESDQEDNYPNIETHYIETDKYKIKTTGKKRRMSPYDTYKLIEKKGERMSPYETYKVTEKKGERMSPYYTYKVTEKKGKQMSPYETYQATDKKGKLLVSGKISTKSSTFSTDQLECGTSTLQPPSLSDSGFIDDGASSKLHTVLMFCDSCKSKQSHNSMVQCCDGHVLCAQCVEKSTKLVLIGEKKGAVGCALQPCTSSIPDSELRKSLPAIVLDLLEEKWKKDTLEALENMKDAVKRITQDLYINEIRCPGCGFTAVLDVGIRKFPCSNCGQAFCRVCDELWEAKDNHDMCYRTKEWTSTDNGSKQQIPEHWSYSNGLEIEPVVELSNESEEFFNISSLIYKDMPVNVLKVYRVQNVRLWEKYSLTKRHMVDDLGDVGINERRLFHGTTADVVEAICKEGFDWRMCGKHGTVYGKGSYFAKSAVMSDTYSSGKTQRRRKNLYQVTSRSRPTASNTRSSGVFHFGASNTNSTPGGLRFGAPSTNSNSGGLRFGAPVTTSNSNSGGLQFGVQSTNINSGGLRLGAPSTNSNSGGLRFGVPSTSTNSNAGGLQFGVQSTNLNSGGLRFGVPSTSTYSNAGGSKFGVPNTSTNSTSGIFQFGSPSTTSNPGGLQFGSRSTNSNPGGLQFGASSTNSNSSGSIFDVFNSNAAGNPFTGSSTNSNSVSFGLGLPLQPVGLASSSSSCLMFVARVLIGRTCLGNSDMRRPEKKFTGESTHSAVNDLTNPTIHVIFDSSQCYPEYLIQYSPCN